MKKNNIKPEIATFILATTLLNTTAFAGFLPISYQKINKSIPQTESQKILEDIKLKENNLLANNVITQTTVTHVTSSPAAMYAAIQAPTQPPIYIESGSSSAAMYAAIQAPTQPPIYVEGSSSSSSSAAMYAAIQMPDVTQSVRNEAIIEASSKEMMQINSIMARYAGPAMTTKNQIINEVGSEINNINNIQNNINNIPQIDYSSASNIGAQLHKEAPVMIEQSQNGVFQINYNTP